MDGEPDTVSAYSGTANLEAMEVATNYRRHIVELVAREVGDPRPDHRMLDFGAGMGTYAQSLQELGHTVTCVEADAALRRRLGDSGLITVASLSELDGQRFDTVYSINVLEHIEDDAAALRAVRGLLAPNGTLVVYVPAFQALFTAMDHKVGHLRRYRRLPLVQLVADAGFRVRICHYADPLGFFATLAYRVLGSRRGDLNPGTVALYDRLLFPASRALENVTGGWFGKNLVLVADRSEIDDRRG